MLIELFVVGGLWFWGFIAAIIVMELISVANESYGFSVAGLLAFLGILQFCTAANPAALAKDNPGWVGVGILGYLVLGVLYMVFKWRRHVIDRVEEANKYGRNVSGVRVDENKERLMGWAAFWPFSLTIYILSDFVRNIYESIYNALKDSLQKMSDRLVAKYSR